MRNKILLAVGSAALLALVATALLWSRTPHYKALFANVSERDAGAVIAALSQLNVPYQFSEVGGVIMVPAERLHETRVRLAAQGLPKGGQMGFELVEGQKFGTTQFQERLNYQRGLEGELARSIMALGAVANARVHLALPTTHGFFRDQQKPSASVLVTLYPGQMLDGSQIGGIVHLVSSSVPELSPKQVSVVDQTGALVSGQDDNAQKTGLDASQLHYRQAVEQAYNGRILEILEPIVGRGNVKAQVTADLDFTVTESTAEQFRPNQGNEPAAVRSQQVNESSGPGSQATPPGGVPGALTNQPPVPPAAPINGQAPAGNAAAATGESRRESTTNFEVDKTVRVVRNATGTLRRLTAAVVVNHRKSVDKKGKPVSTPLTEAEMTQIQSLVQEAIGFTKDRGDSLQVANVSFTVEEVPVTEPVPIWREPEIMSVVRSVGLQMGLVLLGLLVLFGVIKPALKRQPRPVSKPASTERVVADDIALPAPNSTQTAPHDVHDDVLRLARDNPATVANVVRSWINA